MPESSRDGLNAVKTATYVAAFAAGVVSVPGVPGNRGQRCCRLAAGLHCRQPQESGGMNGLECDHARVAEAGKPPEYTL